MRDEQQTDTKQQTTTSESHKFNIAPALIAGKVEDGGRYVLIRQDRQSDEPQVWSTEDPAFTSQLLQLTSRTTEPA